MYDQDFKDCSNHFPSQGLKGDGVHLKQPRLCSPDFRVRRILLISRAHIANLSSRAGDLNSVLMGN